MSEKPTADRQAVEPIEVVMRVIAKGPTNGCGFCFFCNKICNCSGLRSSRCHHEHAEGCLWNQLLESVKFNGGILTNLTYRCRVKVHKDIFHDKNDFFVKKVKRYVSAIGEAQGLDAELFGNQETWVAYYEEDEQERTLVPLKDFIDEVEGVIL